MAKQFVWLKWVEDEEGTVFKAVHVDVDAALEQAAAEQKDYLGVFDGPDEDAKKLATVKGAK